MAHALVNGVRLHCELEGNSGPVLVLVHGSWDSLHDWDAIVPALAKSFRVLRYDRRGHSQSERPAGQGSVHEDVADLAALIGHFGFAPAWVVGNSFGASISLRLAATHPELLRGLIAHEPPLFSLLADDPVIAPLLADVQRKIDAVAERIANDDPAGATEQFVETVALGPGTWQKIPPEGQDIMIRNAPTFLDESRDPAQLAFDLAWLRDFRKPTLLTMGDRSPPFFAPVVRRIAGVLAQAKLVTMAGAGHAPHVSHPDAYVDEVRTFIQDH
jgi:pimeloyl-ACP methyl ester carboxylesterase